MSLITDIKAVWYEILVLWVFHNRLHTHFWVKGNMPLFDFQKHNSNIRNGKGMWKGGSNQINLNTRQGCRQVLGLCQVLGHQGNIHVSHLYSAPSPVQDQHINDWSHFCSIWWNQVWVIIDERKVGHITWMVIVKFTQTSYKKTQVYNFRNAIHTWDFLAQCKLLPVPSHYLQLPY